MSRPHASSVSSLHWNSIPMDLVNLSGIETTTFVPRFGVRFVCFNQPLLILCDVRATLAVNSRWDCLIFLQIYIYIWSIRYKNQELFDHTRLVQKALDRCKSTITLNLAAELSAQERPREKLQPRGTSGLLQYFDVDRANQAISRDWSTQYKNQELFDHIPLSRRR